MTHLFTMNSRSPYSSFFSSSDCGCFQLSNHILLRSQSANHAVAVKLPKPVSLLSCCQLSFRQFAVTLLLPDHLQFQAESTRHLVQILTILITTTTSVQTSGWLSRTHSLTVPKRLFFFTFSTLVQEYIFWFICQLLIEDFRYTSYECFYLDLTFQQYVHQFK